MWGCGPVFIFSRLSEISLIASKLVIWTPVNMRPKTWQVMRSYWCLWTFETSGVWRLSIDKLLPTLHGGKDSYLGVLEPCKWRQQDPPKSSYLPVLRSFVSIRLWRPGLAGTRAQSCDRYGSGTLHPGHVLGSSLPFLSPAFRRSHFSHQVPPSATTREILAAKGGTVGEKDFR